MKSPLIKLLLASILGVPVVFGASGIALAVNYGDSTPAVTYNPDRNEFLGTYENWDASYTSEALKGARFTGSGAQVGAAFDIVPSDGNLAILYGARLLYNPNTSTYTALYVVYNNPNYEIYLQTLSGTTGLPVGARKLVGLGGTNAFAYDASAKLYLVIFSDSSGNGTIHAQYVKDDLSLQGAPFDIVVEPNGPFYYVDLAASGTGTFVGVSTNGYNALYTSEYFTLAAGSTATLTPAMIASGASNLRIARNTSTGEFWFIDTRTSDAYTIDMRKFTLPSTLSAAISTFGPSSSGPGPVMAFNAFSGKFLAVYSDGSYAGKGLFLNSDGSAFASEFDIAPILGYEGLAAAASSRCGTSMAGWLTSSGSQNTVHFGAFGDPCAASVHPESSSLDFGSVRTDESRTATATFHVELASTTPGAASISGTGAAAFSIVSDGCASTPVAEHASCDVKVQFAPKSVGGFAATLTLPGTSPANVSLGGSATAAPVAPFALTLSSPEAGKTGVNSQRALLIWKKAAGKAVTYRVYVCSDPTFAGCTAKAPNQTP